MTEGGLSPYVATHKGRYFCRKMSLFPEKVPNDNWEDYCAKTFSKNFAAFCLKILQLKGRREKPLLLFDNRIFSAEIGYYAMTLPAGGRACRRCRHDRRAGTGLGREKKTPRLKKKFPRHSCGFAKKCP